MATSTIVWIVVAVIALLVVIAVAAVLARKQRERSRIAKSDEIREQVRQDSVDVERREALARETAARARAAEAEAEAKAAEAERLKSHADKHFSHATRRAQRSRGAELARGRARSAGHGHRCERRRSPARRRQASGTPQQPGGSQQLERSARHGRGGTQADRQFGPAAQHAGVAAGAQPGQLHVGKVGEEPAQPDLTLGARERRAQAEVPAARKRQMLTGIGAAPRRSGADRRTPRDRDWRPPGRSRPSRRP